MRLLAMAVICVSISTLASGCNFGSSSSTETPIVTGIPNDCNSSNTETYFDDANTIPIAPGDKVGQSLSPSGSVQASLALNQVILHMGTQGVSTATLAIYQNTNDIQPDSGQLLGSATVTTGLGSASTSTPVTFNISPPVTLVPGTYYGLVLSGTGGTIQLSTSATQTLPTFLETYTLGSWNVQTGTSMSISFSYYVSCPN